MWRACSKHLRLGNLQLIFGARNALHILRFGLWIVLQTSRDNRSIIFVCATHDDGNGLEPIVPASEHRGLGSFYLPLAPARSAEPSVSVNTEILHACTCFAVFFPWFSGIKHPLWSWGEWCTQRTKAISHVGGIAATNRSSFLDVGAVLSVPCQDCFHL